MANYPEAIAALQKALRFNPNDFVAWYILGNANKKLARYPEAIAAYRQATLLNTWFADAWNNLGVAYAKSGNLSAALEAEVLVNLLMNY
jgi:tetratricopeptide (TPR) repeat protein